MTTPSSEPDSRSLFRGVNMSQYVGGNRGPGDANEHIMGTRPAQQSIDELTNKFTKLSSGIDDLLSTIKRSQSQFNIPRAMGGISSLGTGPSSTLNGGGSVFGNVRAGGPLSPGNGPTSFMGQGVFSNRNIGVPNPGSGPQQLYNQPNGVNGGQVGPQTYNPNPGQPYSGDGQGRTSPNGGGAAIGGVAAGITSLGLSYANRNFTNFVQGNYVATRFAQANTSGGSFNSRTDAGYKQIYGNRNLNNLNGVALNSQDLFQAQLNSVYNAGYAPGTAGFSQYQTIGAQNAVLNPTAGAAGGQAVEQNYQTARTINRLRPYGIQTIGPDGQPRSALQVGNQFADRSYANKGGFAAQNKQTRNYAVNDPNSGLRLSLNSAVSQGLISQDTADAQLNALRAENTAINSGATPQQFQDAVAKGDRKQLRKFGVDDSTFEKLRDQGAAKRTVDANIIGSFNDGLQKAAGLLTDFNSALARSTSGGLGGAAAHAFGGGSGFLGGISGSVGSAAGIGGALGLGRLLSGGRGLGAVRSLATGGGGGRLGALLGRATGNLPSASEVISGGGGAGRAGGLLSRLGGGSGASAVLGKLGIIGAGISAAQYGVKTASGYAHSFRRGYATQLLDNPFSPTGVTNDLGHLLGIKSLQTDQALNALSGDGGTGGPTTNTSAKGTPKAGSNYKRVFPANGPITQAFGHNGHPGIDIGAPRGSPIVAAADGVVIFAGTSSGFGHSITIKHPDGVATLYGHMYTLPVRVGQQVKAGQTIAQVGADGNSNGPHLHFELHPSGSIFGGVVDPVPWLGGAAYSASAASGASAGTSTQSNTDSAGSPGGATAMSNTSEASAIASALAGGGASSSGSTSQQSSGSSSSGDASSSGAPGAMPTGSVKQWIDTALGILHLDPKKYEKGVNTIVQLESAGNPHAQNNTDSNARAGHPSKGLMQTIDSTFNQWSLPGHKDIWNPVDNIIAGVRYGISRYGESWLAAGGNASHGQGYAKGSWEIVRDEVAQLHRGEMVLPATTADKLRQSVVSGNKGGSGGVTLQFRQGAIVIQGVDAATGTTMANSLVNALAKDARVQALMKDKLGGLT